MNVPTAAKTGSHTLAVLDSPPSPTRRRCLALATAVLVSSWEG